MGQTTMSIRVDNDLKGKFDTLCNDFGLSSSAALTIFMKTVVRERKIPFEVKTDSVEEARSKAYASFYRMREDARQSHLQDMSLEEINQIIAEVRNRRQQNEQGKGE